MENSKYEIKRNMFWKPPSDYVKLYVFIHTFYGSDLNEIRLDTG